MHDITLYGHMTVDRIFDGFEEKQSGIESVRNRHVRRKVPRVEEAPFDLSPQACS